jgi:hypothetical protein
VSFILRMRRSFSAWLFPEYARLSASDLRQAYFCVNCDSVRLNFSRLFQFSSCPFNTFDRFILSTRFFQYSASFMTFSAIIFLALSLLTQFG